jgi:hypothetical protein
MLGDPKYDQRVTAALPDGTVVNMRAAFPRSGVYDASSLKPLWQFGWYSFQSDLLYSDDFQNIVRVNREAFPSHLALRFYSRGKLIRTYACAKLLTGLRSGYFLPFATWDWHFRWYEDYRLNRSHTQLVLSTARRRMHIGGGEVDFGLQEFYTFDMSTGSVISRRRVGIWRVWANAMAALAVVVMIGYAVRLLWKHVDIRSHRVGFPVQRTSDDG